MFDNEITSSLFGGMIHLVQIATAEERKFPRCFPFRATNIRRIVELNYSRVIIVFQRHMKSSTAKDHFDDFLKLGLPQDF